jgi:hypothetical protein
MSRDLSAYSTDDLLRELRRRRAEPDPLVRLDVFLAGQPNQEATERKILRERVVRTADEVRPLIDRYAAAGMGIVEPVVPRGKALVVRRNRGSHA